MPFQIAVALVLKHEGGYINDPRDPGGETNFGISKRAYPSVDIKNLTKEKAVALYFRDYWTPIRGDALPSTVAMILFDMAVNMGIAQAVKLLQRSLGVTADGVIGAGTISAANRVNARALAERLTQERILFYASLRNFTLYGAGWVARSINTLTEAVA